MHREDKMLLIAATAWGADTAGLKARTGLPTDFVAEVAPELYVIRVSARMRGVRND
jgi:hypothetical protein